MMTVNLIYNPYRKSTLLYINNKKITSFENRIYNFINAEEFEKWLHPFNKRYVMWAGILPELIAETNDDELHIFFESTNESFKKIEQAFEAAKDTVENMGFKNNWKLTHVENFEDKQLTEKVISHINIIKEFTTTRTELLKLNDIEREVLKCSSTNQIKEQIENLKMLIDMHITKISETQYTFSSSTVDVDISTWKQFAEILITMERW